LLGNGFYGTRADSPPLSLSPRRSAIWCAALIASAALTGCAKLETPTARLQRIESTCATRPEADRRACVDMLTWLEIAQQQEDAARRNSGAVCTSFGKTTVCE